MNKLNARLKELLLLLEKTQTDGSCEWKKSLRVINYFLEKVYCRKSREGLLVLDSQKVFRTFLQVLQDQRSKSNQSARKAAP